MKLRITDEKRSEISEGMTGLFFEDINYGLDGGLYAEMIENRSFEFYNSGGSKYNWFNEYDGLYGWSLYEEEDVCPQPGAFLQTGGREALRIGAGRPLNSTNPHYLEFTASEGAYAFKNKAYDGIFMKAGMKYKLSLYARSDDYDGSIFVDIIDSGRLNADGAPCPATVAEAEIARGTTALWQRYEAEISSDEDIEGGVFVVRLDRPGAVCFDFISMMPQDAVCGVFRRDLAELLRELRPGFLRFPGGCVVEGNTIENMYRWKASVGAPEERRANWNRWAVHGTPGHDSRYSHYNQTLGAGYYEYFLLCEYIGARALPVVNVGMACQYESRERFELEDPAFLEFIRDALDLIEFANGGPDTRWGGLRARMGHEEPFNLELLGIGNEQWETEESRYFERYRRFEQAIHEKYPGIKLIGSAGPDVTSSHYTDAWEFYRRETEKRRDFVYAVDEHYYVKPEWLFNNTGFYDSYPRDVKVFAGEYAAHVGSGMNRPGLNCWEAALAEAAFLTGVERNSDVVVMASYAPLLARLGYAQWSPDMIWFDAKSAYTTPSYYVQKLYSTCTGRYCLGLEAEGAAGEVKYTASYNSEKHCIYIKLVNHGSRDVDVDLELAPGLRPAEGGSIAEYAEPVVRPQEKDGAFAYVMTGGLSDCNTIDEPEKIAPVRRRLAAARRFSYRLEPYSFHVLCIPADMCMTV